MRKQIFGRKNSQGPIDENRGHAAVLRMLNEKDKIEPLTRLQLAGRIVMDLVVQMISNEKRARAEDLLAILGANGGFSCIVGVLHSLEIEGKSPQSVGMMEVQDKDGNRYYFGDLPNYPLLESELALLSLTLGAAQQLGGDVSLEATHETMGFVAKSVGGTKFGKPRLPDQNMPGDELLNYVKYLWPKIVEALDLYEVPVTKRPTAIGFAIQNAITATKDVLDPGLSARLVMECAVPMSKIDPSRFN